MAERPREHLEGALDWLMRAQDATPDDGVARAYSVAWHPYFEARGWQPSYPETTGYIIPTFFDAATAVSRSDLRERAIRMANWECEVQLPSGAVQGGVIGEQASPTPAVFNTGQVILGWLRAHRETREERFLEAVRRAADYLVSVQGPDGSFQKGRSQFARSDLHTYNTRVGWALCAAGLAIGDRRYEQAGLRSAEYGVSRQRENGWFEDNCLSDPTRPLLHTIAYATRGILETGALLDREDLIDAAERTARAVASRQRRDGGLPGRFTREWGEAAEWDCLTGDAQMAIIWYRLAQLRGSTDLAHSADRICRFLMATQNREATDPGLAGGIKGSFPFDGEYGRYELLNWAAKFFVDALLLGARLEEKDRPETYR